jgi:hypothetical protein
MKRDMDLVRDLLFAIEALDRVRGEVQLPYDKYNSEQIYYHVRLLHEAGLAHAVNCSTGMEFCWVPTSLTWQGHEFLDAARNDEVWNKAKSQIKSVAGSISFDILKSLLNKLALSLLGM